MGWYRHSSLREGVSLIVRLTLVSVIGGHCSKTDPASQRPLSRTLIPSSYGPWLPLVTCSIYVVSGKFEPIELLIMTLI